MNTIATFRLCDLTDDKLLEKIDSKTDEIFKSGKIPNRNVPARPNDDYDLLIGELIFRFKEMRSR